MQRVKLLSQLLADRLQSGFAVSPVSPTGSDRSDKRIQETCLPQVQKHVGIFVVLNSVTDVLQTDSWRGFAGSDRTWRIQEDSVARSSEAAAASSRVHVVPAGDGVSASPAVSAIVQDALRALRPV